MVSCYSNYEENCINGYKMNVVIGVYINAINCEEQIFTNMIHILVYVFLLKCANTESKTF